MPVVEYEVFEEMEEDLVELATSMTINETLSPWLVKLCRLSCREDENELAAKIRSFSDLLPEQVGISEYFTCNQSSKLALILKDLQ